MSDAFTKTDPDVFDLDSWIDGAKLPEKSVTVYGRADLVARWEELDRQLSAMDDNDDERLGGNTPATIAAEMTKVRADLDKSALTFTFRAILEDERKKAEKDAAGDDDKIAYNVLSVQAVKPRVSPEQWPKIRAKIGEGQFFALLEASTAAAYERKVSVPFSLAHSAALNTQSS